MTEDARTLSEQEYYALNQRVWGCGAAPPLYDLVTLPALRLRRDVARLAGVDRRTTVLDVATGTGAQALAFAERCGPIVGIDISPAMLRLARAKRRRANLSFVQADATALPFEDERFDLSCVSFALHEMPRSVRERVVRELARVTRPEGKVLIVDWGLPRTSVARWLVYHTVRLFEPDEYAEFVRSDLPALLAGAGLAVREERPALLGAVRVITGAKAARGRSRRVAEGSASRSVSTIGASRDAGASGP